MKVTFLGTADGHTSLHRDHSGLLLRAPESSFLLDCGAPAAQFLLREGAPVEIPRHVWLSHMHSDHVSQFGSFIQSLWLRGRRTPLHVYAPAEMTLALQDWLEKCLLFPELLGFVIQWHPLRSGRVIHQDGYTLTPFATRHLKSLAGYFQSHYPTTCFDCFGLILDHEGKRTVYSSDLATPKDLLPALKKPIHDLFCELTHFSEKDLFTTLAPYDIRRLWITHYPDRLWRKQALLRKLARTAKCKSTVFLTHDQMTETL